MNERVRELRKALGLTMEQFGARIGITKQTVSRIESGANNITDRVVLTMRKEFGVSEEWLRCGIGKMMDPAPVDELDAIVKKYGLTINDRILIEKFIRMTPENRSVLLEFYREVSDAMAEMVRQKEEEYLFDGMTLEEKVADYRRQLELELQSRGKSSALREEA